MQMQTFLLVLVTAVLGVGGLAVLLVGFIEFCQLADAGNFPRAVAYALTVLLAAAVGFACKISFAWVRRFVRSGTKL